MAETSGTLSYAGGEEGIRSTFAAPYLVLLIVADRSDIESVRLSLAEVEAATMGRGERFAFIRRDDGDGATLAIEVPDGWMSTRHLRLEQDPSGAWCMEDLGSKNGCYRNGQRCSKATLADGDVISSGNTTMLFRSEVERSHLEAADASAQLLRTQPAAARTLNLPFSRMMADLAKVATSSVSIVIGGESGTGKEVSARFVHESSRRQGRFIAVNCGALPENLVESELFGHRKGAFSGATNDRVGLVQSSDGGTLFLDEIAELPLQAQVKLLRTLQEREVTPVGATRPIPVDLRVVAATHSDLPGRVKTGLFREDLYARLAGVCFSLPPLRERREDLGLLIAAMLRRLRPEVPATLEREAVWAMALYSWPRNIRELEQAIAAASAWAEGGAIGLRHLPPVVAATLQPEKASENDPVKDALVAALRKHGGNVSAAARELGKARVQIRRWCKRYGLQPEEFR